MPPPVLDAWPDAEALLIALLDPVAPVWQSTPAEITEPLIQVARIGGADDSITDAPMVVVVCYGVGATGYDTAKAMAEQCRQVLLAAGGTGVTVPGYAAPVLIDTVHTVAPPAEVAGDNPDLRRKVSTYQLTYRRPF